MKFKIVMLYDDKREEIGQLTEGVARAYCTRHGYDFAAYRSVVRPDLQATYSIGEVIATEMQTNPQIDWFFRLDADSIIVRPEMRLESLLENMSCSLAASEDANGLCFGLFAIKNSGWSMELLKIINFLGDVDPDRWREYDGHNTFDQSALKVLMRHFSRVSQHIALIPQNVIQNPKTPFSQDAFIMHYWSGSGLSRIAAKMREYIANGWSPNAFYRWGS